MSDKLIDQISAPLVSNYLETAKDLKEQMNLSTVDSNISSNLQISQVYSYLSNLPNDADAAKKKDVVYNWSTYMSYKYGNDEELITSFSGNPINVSRVNADSIGSLVVNGKTTQAGTGTPSPTNIRPITGVTPKVTVNGTEYSLATDSLFDGDTADIVSGKVHRKWKIYTFTGEENWIVDNSSYDSFFIDDDNELNGKYIIPSNIICSHFMADDASSMAIDSLGILLQGNATGVVQISTGDTNLDAANFKTWVKSQYNAGTPLQILYELTVPNNIDTSGNTIAIQQGSVLIKSENTIDLKLPIYSDYTKNSDYIFTGDLYNTLCDNITTEYANYLKTGLSVDLGTFAIAYQLMLSDFCDNINNFIDTFNEIYQENICNNQNSVPLLQIQKDKNTNTLIATSPALIKAGKTDITNNTLPSALELYYNYIINKKCCKVKIMYLDSTENNGLTYSNQRIHRIREIK